MTILDLAHSVGSEAGDYTPPPMVPGRVLYMDADSMVYDCARLDESFEDNLQYLVPYIQQWRVRAGAEHIECHLTMGNKGNRDKIATLLEYQANRKGKDRELHERVTELKQWLVSYSHPRLTVIGWGHQEADDGVTQAMYSASFSPKAVLFSRDKDLWMVPGLHLGKDKPWEIEEFPNGYGSCWMYDTKLKGKGHSWFWHQVLMGDRVDNIPGLPALAVELQRPTVVEERLRHEIKFKASQKTNRPLTQEAWLTRQAKLKEVLAARKPKRLGPKTAYEYLYGCSTNKQAFIKVKKAYEAYYGTKPFPLVDWRGEQVIKTAGDMLLEQARLLWMRREKDEDVLVFFDQIAKGEIK